jgi:hypothetical protein
MRTGANAIQAERTVEIAGLLGLKQIEFATPCVGVPPNAIVGPAGLTRLSAFDFDLSR